MLQKYSVVGDTLDEDERAQESILGDSSDFYPRSTVALRRKLLGWIECR